MLIALIGFPHDAKAPSLIERYIDGSRLVVQETEEEISLDAILRLKPDVVLFYALTPSSLDLARQLKHRYPLTYALFMTDDLDIDAVYSVMQQGFENVPREASERYLLARLRLINERVKGFHDKNSLHTLWQDPGYLIGTDGGFYMVEKELGSQEQARTFVAHRQDGQKVFIKVFPLEQQEQQLPNLMRFIQEAWVTIFKSYKHLAKGYDVILTPEACVYIREWVKGTSLATLLDDGGPMELDRAAEIVLHIAKTMEFYSQYRIVHRDISPSNIIITEQGAKLLDFGVAKVGNVHLSGEGLIVGNPYYISPQQIKGAAPDIRTDIYTLGATFYHMVVGKIPFYEALPRDLNKISNVQLINWIEVRLKEDPVPPHEANPEVSSCYAYIIQKMMARDPLQRYQTPRELIHDLQQALRHEEDFLEISFKSRLSGWFKSRIRPILIGFLSLCIIGTVVTKVYFPHVNLDLPLMIVILIILVALLLGKRV